MATRAVMKSLLMKKMLMRVMLVVTKKKLQKKPELTPSYPSSNVPIK